MTVRHSMIPLLLMSLLAVLLAPASASADGLPIPWVGYGWDGVAAPSGAVRYVAIPARGSTVVAAVRTDGGRVVRFRSVRGSYGVPIVAGDGTGGGVSTDGRTLVVARTPVRNPLQVTSQFKVLDTRNLRLRHTITLPGDFSFDAVSPDGDVLYLIQLISQSDQSRYVVRAYDLAGGFLRSDAVSDPRSPGERMRGYPLTRVSTADGVWVYTLYQSPGSYPFVHALNTRLGQAICIDLPWRRGQNRLTGLRLRLARGERELILGGRGAVAAIVDTRTYRVRAAALPPLRR